MGKVTRRDSGYVICERSLVPCLERVMKGCNARGKVGLPGSEAKVESVVHGRVEEWLRGECLNRTWEVLVGGRHNCMERNVVDMRG